MVDDLGIAAVRCRGQWHIGQCQRAQNIDCGNTMLTVCLLLPQGSNRLQRGLLYRDYLRTFSGFRHTPQVVVVPGMGHDQVPMLNAPEFISFVSS